MHRNRRVALVLSLGAALTAALVAPASTIAATPKAAAVPTITSFSPTTGKLGTSVVITGTNFASPATVKFNGVASTSVTVNAATKITTTAPNGASTGKIAVTTAGGTATSSAVFTVAPGVTVSPSIGSPSLTKTLYFGGMSAYEAVDIYFDTADIALASAAGNGTGNLTITIPATATPGTHWVTAVGRKSGYSAQFLFTVRTDWTQFGRLADHQNSNPLENVISTATVSQLDEAWRTSSYGVTYSSPADVGGVIYSGFADGSVRAFSEASGALKWTAMTGDEVYSSPAVYQGVVYVGSEDDYVYAFDASTGARKWRYQTGNAVLGSPTVVQGVVYVGSYDNKVYALNATTGALVWTFPTHSGVFSSPAVANGVVYVGSFDDYVYAIRASTGAVIWSRQTGGAVTGSPVVLGGSVYVGSDDDKMYSLRTSNGSVKWSYTTSGEIEGTSAVTGGVVYVSNDNANVYALNAATGTLRWSTTSPEGYSLDQDVVVANGVVYVGSSESTFALAASYGGLLTSLPVGTLYGGATVVNGAVIVPDFSDGVIARFTINGGQTGAVAARPAPATLQHHSLALALALAVDAGHA